MWLTGYSTGHYRYDRKLRKLYVSSTRNCWTKYWYICAWNLVTTRALHCKTFYCGNCWRIVIRSSFVIAKPWRPSLIFVGKAGSLPLEWSDIKESTSVGSCLVCKYKTRGEVNGSDKNSSLLRYVYNYCSKKFYSTGPRRQECLILAVASNWWRHKNLTALPSQKFTSLHPTDDVTRILRLCIQLMTS